MNENEIAGKALKWFLVFTLGFSVIWEILYMVTKGQMSLLMLVLMWTPGVTAIVIRNIFYRKQPLLGMKLRGMKYVLAGLGLPAVYLGVSYGLYWVLYKEEFLGTSFLAGQIREVYGVQGPEGMTITLFLISGFLSSMVSAAGEEIGWRGFMYPAMEKIWTRKKALLVSGAIWAAWHLPLILLGLYQSETVVWYGVPMFIIEIMGMSVILAWLRTRSGSVWPAIALHAAHNLLDQQIFRVMTGRGNSAYFAGEQGFITVLLVLAIAAVAVVLWGRADRAAAEGNGAAEQS